jgi:hypothetical protein
MLGASKTLDEPTRCRALASLSQNREPALGNALF